MTGDDARRRAAIRIKAATPQIVEAVERGVGLHRASDESGLRMARIWWRRGRDGDSLYRQFYEDVERARARWAATRIAQHRETMKVVLRHMDTGMKAGKAAVAAGVCGTTLRVWKTYEGELYDWWREAYPDAIERQRAQARTLKHQAEQNRRQAAKRANKPITKKYKPVSKQQGWVYFIQAAGNGRVKVGYTGGPVAQRLRQLQVGSPVELRVLSTRPGTRATETALHRKLARWRSHGEWFEPSPEVMAEASRAEQIRQLPLLMVLNGR